MDNNPFLQHDPTTVTNTSQSIQDLLIPISQHINILTQLKQALRISSEVEMIQQLKQIHNIIKHIEYDDLKSEIDKNICIELKQQIQEGNSAVQLEILNIILIIAERGAEMVKKYNNNQFYQIFKYFGLLERIEQIFLQLNLIQKNANSQCYNCELFYELVQIISFINQSNIIDQNILEACGQYFKFQIVNLIQILRNLKNQKDLEEEQKQQQIETEMKKGSGIINAISCIAIDWSNQQYLVKQLKIHEDIAPLLHIRCTVQLNCSQCLNIPESESTNQLLSSIYNILAELSLCEKAVSQFLLDKHNIFLHLTPLIISFSTNHSHQIRKSNQIQHTSNSSYPTTILSIISSKLNLLYSLLIINYSLCQTAYYTPNIIKALINLTEFERKQHKSIKIEKQNSQIRLQSNHCLDRICSLGDYIMKGRILTEYKYMRIQIETIGSGGGTEEQNDKVIFSGLININYFFFNIQEMIDDKFDTWTHLIKISNEQLEDEGGFEEIEANLFHKKQFDDDFVQSQTKCAKAQMNNIKKDYSNK